MNRVPLLAVGLLSMALVLTGCVAPQVPTAAPTASAYQSDVASRLESAVLSVSSAAAGDDPTTALVRLDELTATLADTRARSQVGAARFDSISAAIALVRADLEALILAQKDSKSRKTDKPANPNKENHGTND